MTTTVVKTIKSGGDYTTLQAHEDASPANLVSADQIWRGESSGAFSSASNLLTVSGTTVDATRYFDLSTEASFSFRDNVNVQTNALKWNSSNGSSILVTGSYVNAITVNQDFCRFSNLQVAVTGTAGGSGAGIMSSLASGSASMTIDFCIIETVRGLTVSLYGSGQKIRNSLCRQLGNGRPAIAQVANGAQAYNTTFATPGDITVATVAITGSYTTATLTNCNFFRCTNVSSGTAPTFTTCYTSVASPPSGCTNAANSTANFVGVTVAAADYRIPTGSAMKDTGTTDATNAATDIAKTARPQGAAYDVGCWEFVAAAAGAAAKSTFVRQAVNRASTY